EDRPMVLAGGSQWRRLPAQRIRSQCRCSHAGEPAFRAGAADALRADPSRTTRAAAAIARNLRRFAVGGSRLSITKSLKRSRWDSGAAAGPDGIFPVSSARPLVGANAQNRPIGGDSPWNREDSESSKFPFEIKSANF